MLNTNSPGDHEGQLIHRHIKPQITPWTNLDFGKYDGKTLPQIAIIDADYFFWAFEKQVFKTDPLRTEAELISQRAMRIRIPDVAVGAVKVLYGVHSLAGKLDRVWLVPADFPKEDGGSPTGQTTSTFRFLGDCAPTTRPAQSSSMKAVRQVVFHGAKLTKARCERFFSDPRILPVIDAGADKQRGGRMGTKSKAVLLKLPLDLADRVDQQ